MQASLALVEFLQPNQRAATCRAKDSALRPRGRADPARPGMRLLCGRGDQLALADVRDAASRIVVRVGIVNLSELSLPARDVMIKHEKPDRR
jgi:hypothetical protein